MRTPEPVFTLSRLPLLTLLLGAAQVLVYLSLAGSTRVISLDTLIDAGAKVRDNVFELGETWRLLTANVLHRDGLHLAFNTFFLLNVGGPVENAYRPGAYAALLVASALGTTAASVALSSVPSVGASGVVLGLFAAASVFGFRHGSALPRRYRRYFGGAALPYALFILYVGLVSPETDNWGHLGGFVGGGLAALFLRSRLDPRPSSVGPAMGTAALLVVLLAAGPALAPLLPPLEVTVDPRFGLSWARPPGWEAGENHLGDPAWGNRLGVVIGVKAERREDRPFTLDEVRTDFFFDLDRLERAGEITAVRLESERPLLIEGGRGIELQVRLASRAGPQRTLTLLIERGHHRARVVLSAPERWAQPYHRLFSRMAGAVSLVEPAELTRSRRVAEAFPGMSSAAVALGDQLAAIGESQSAAASYQRALTTVPDHPGALLGLVRLGLAYGADLDTAERAAAALHQADPADELVVDLLVDLRRRQGQLGAACEALWTALDARPSPAVRARLDKLGCRRF